VTSYIAAISRRGNKSETQVQFGVSSRNLSVFLTNVCYFLQFNVAIFARSLSSFLATIYRSGAYDILLKLASLVLIYVGMKSSAKLLLVVAAVAALFIVQPARADHFVQAGPSVVTVPDGGSTISLLGFALLGVAALRSKLRR
jgi:hypothetical protein